MTERGASGIPKEWRQVACKDWARVRRQLKDGDAEAAGYFLKKIHALHDLLSDAVTYQPALEKFRGLCERVSGYYIAERYPPLVPSELTCADIERDREQARQLIHAILPEERLD